MIDCAEIVASEWVQNELMKNLAYAVARLISSFLKVEAISVIMPIVSID